MHLGILLLVNRYTYIHFCVQVRQVSEEALQPEDRDVADERKRVLECQPVVESMVGSPLILQELTKVSIKLYATFCSGMCMSITVGPEARHHNSTTIQLS